MSVVSVTNIIDSTDGFLTRSKTASALVTQDTYTFPLEQNYLSITNNGNYDIEIDMEGYENLIIHKGQTWENTIDFTSFNIVASVETTSFTFISKEYDTMPITISSLWDKMAIRDLTETGDLILATDDATTSAAVINAAIAGATEVFERDVTIEMQRTAETVHTWFNGVFPVSVVATSTAGIATVPAYATFIDGEATVTITHTGTWVEADTIVLTVAETDFYGYTVSATTSTDTLAA